MEICSEVEFGINCRSMKLIEYLVNDMNGVYVFDGDVIELAVITEKSQLPSFYWTMRTGEENKLMVS